MTPLYFKTKVNENNYVFQENLKKTNTSEKIRYPKTFFIQSLKDRRCLGKVYYPDSISYR